MPPATFRAHRRLPFPPERIFAAFSDPALLARWWGPDGFTNTFEIFDFKPGGRWKFVMHGPNGSNHPNESLFLKIEAPHTLVIQHDCPPHFLLTITLTPHENDTALSWTQEFEDPTLAARLRPIIEPANEQNLNRLQSVLAEAK